MRRALAIVLIAAAASACGDTANTAVGQLNFDRPVDIAFACYGGLRILDSKPNEPPENQFVDITAQPQEACVIRSGAHDTGTPTPVPVGQENLTDKGGAPIAGANWYGFILNSAPGTVSLASFPTKPSTAFTGGDVLVLDADPLTPGTNGISVGEDPIAIATDRSGCFEITANAGSCDLSALEINSALDYDKDPAVNVTRTAVKNANGQELLARPAAMAFEPPGGAIGYACPATPQGVAYVAYPTCHLVAAVDTSTGTIVGGITYDAAGAPSVIQAADLPSVSCPAECGGGATFTPGPRPVTVDLEKDPRTETVRLAIGAENSHSLTIVELGADALPMSLSQIALEDPSGLLGVQQVAIAPTLGAGGQNGTINDDIATGGQFQFVYAITNDGSIRVADILEVNRECDTQVDPRLVEDLTNVRQMSCFPVGEPTNPGRRPGATGPGITLTGDAVPTSIDVFRSDAIPGDARQPGPDLWVGYFGVITASSGVTYVLNVDDDNYRDFEDPSAPLSVWTPLAYSHQLRDAVEDRNLIATATVDGTEKPICNTLGPDPDQTGIGDIGGPRAPEAPTKTIPDNTFAGVKSGELPSIRQVECVGSDATLPVSELMFAAPTATRDLVYRDLRVLRDENWSLSWEGTLSLDSSVNDVDGPPQRLAQMTVDNNGMRLTDASQPYCAAGVEDYDIVQFRGCDPSLGDAQCPVGYTCFVHPNSEVTGLGSCMLKDEADRLATACKDFLTSQRRYTVARSSSGELQLLPRKSVLPTTPVDGCVDDNQCAALADYGAQLTNASNPVDTSITNPHTFSCMADPERPPLDGPGQTGKRCIETCSPSQKCSAGSICRIPAGAQEGMCYEGVVPPQACVNAPQRFEVHAHDAFTVIGWLANGQGSGYVHPIVRDPNSDRCIRDPNAHPFDIGRIPLTAPACDPTADPRTGRRADGTFEANPCSLTVAQTEDAPNYVPGTCTLNDPTTTRITRQADAIQFRNRGLTLTMVDPTYPGDATCIRDRMGTLGKIPIVFGGYQVTWRQAMGFRPFTLPLAGAAFPVKVVRGPLQGIWVIDEGDYLSTSLSEASTRGKVFLVQPTSPTTGVNTLE